jgi:ankyrin repeat protein
MMPDDVYDAVDARNVQQLRNLLKSGVDLTRRDEFGDTLLHRAIRQRLPEFVRLLLQHGANINAKGEAGRTPLHIAVSESEGDCEILQVLLEHSPNLELTDNSGGTPLRAATGYPACASLLLEKGAYYDLNSAVSLGDLNRVRELLDKDGLQFAPSPNTLLLSAISAPQHRNQIVDALLKHRANVNEPRSYPPVYAALQDAFCTQDASVLRQIAECHPDTRHVPEPLRRMATRMMQERQDHPAKWLQQYDHIFHVLDDFGITE